MKTLILSKLVWALVTLSCSGAISTSYSLRRLISTIYKWAPQLGVATLLNELIAMNDTSFEVARLLSITIAR